MKTVLLVDDSAFQRRLMNKHLTTSGYEMVGTQNGQEALDYLDRLTPYCIITDLIMPGMNGYELLAHLQETTDVPPIIVSTADIQGTTREECLGLGALAVLNKPVKRAELVALLASIEAGA